MSENHTVRVFVSSPSDVRPERLIAERVVKRLAREFSYHFRLEAVLWEREPLLATQGKPVAPRQLRLTHRNRKFADSPLEGAGFEPSVPIAKGDASQVRSGLAGGLVAFGPDG